MGPRRRRCPFRFFSPGRSEEPSTSSPEAHRASTPGVDAEWPGVGSPAAAEEPEDSTWAWGSGSHRPPWRHGPPWLHKRRFLFIRFVRFIGFLILLFLSGMAALAFVLTRLFNGSGQAAFALWLAGCLLIVAGLGAAARAAARAFGRTIEPLAQVMAGADAVSEGDLHVRVPEGAPGEFGRLATSFNRMVAELERTDQQRRNLTADVAHELRTPLHVIQGNLEGILDGVYTATPEQIELLLDETRQLARLVEDLRTLSLAESGQLPLTFEPLNLRELLEDVVTSFSGQAEAARVELKINGSAGWMSADPSPLMISGDAGRLDQVLSNLVANALRHTSAGGWVRLSAELTGSAQDAHSLRVRIRVADNGSGIPAEDLPFIFDRFWRGDRSRQNQGGGPASTGLGLAISRQLIQAHGGNISVESHPGEGAVFTIDLPGAAATPVPN
jgi:signal transduction histidine kinase